MAILPTRILEIEFDAGVWTNVTSDLVALSTRRGRNKESGAFETGTLTFSLRNDTRKYDPDNTAGTYYGKLRPNRRVRLRATYNAVTYDVMVAYIDRITQVAGGPNDATAEFAASDFFKLLNRAELPRSVYTSEVSDDAPALWYRLDEPVGSTLAVNSGSLGSAYDGSYNTAIYDTTPGGRLGQAGLVVRDSGTALLMPYLPSGANNGVVTPAPIPNVGAGVWEIEFWLKYDAISAGDTLIYAPGLGGRSLLVTVVTGILGFSVRNDSGTLYGVISPTLTAGVTYHVVLQHDAGRQMRIWLNGVESWSSDGVNPTVSTGPITITGPWIIGGSSPASQYTLDEFAVYTAALSGARIAAHNAAGRTPWNGDTPGTRLTRIFSLMATTGSYVLDAGEPTLQATSLDTTILAYAQKVEETTLGSLFVAKNGDVTFLGRNTLVTGSYLTSQATLVDDDSGAGIPYRVANSDVDEARIVTRATVSRDGSVAVRVYDNAAKTEFGWLDETHDGLLHNSDTYSRSYAEWIVNVYKAPTSRVGAVTLELTRDPVNMYPAILALEIGQQVTWKRKAQNTGAVLSIPMRVEAISHTTGPGQFWTTTLQLSPFNLAGGLPVGVWDVGLWDQSVWGI